MIDLLRFVLMIFYAPMRGMRGMRDRGSLAPVALIAFLSQVAYNLVTERFAGTAARTGYVTDLLQAAMTVVLVAVVLVPILTLVANMFERRGSFRVVITQEYAPVAATMFYVLTAANLIALIIAAALHYSGLQAQQVAGMLQQADQTRAALRDNPQLLATAEQLLRDPALLYQALFGMPQVLLFGVGMLIGVKDAFRMSVLRAFGVTVISCFASALVLPIVERVFSSVLGSPFLLIILYFLRSEEHTSELQSHA